MSETQLAIATIPMQQWGELYDDKDALEDVYKRQLLRSIKCSGGWGTVIFMTNKWPGRP